ncbi:uncharacterized protein LOC125494005 [Beta vulgaris subsp. vulgaris]|uniref:uncharacterized protein LOC125494005 n=1 Tax=Beta vulgaris subsp. vulgaris TaxID=3555 RepID=UPI0020374A7C|nr:uncharacterized protein LOC125494005 [Beta vulgaris subsp. vulgaris]
MGLMFVAPTIVEGNPTAKLDKNEIDRMNTSWENAIIVYVVGQNPTMTAMLGFIKAQWGLKSEPGVYKHDEGYFVVKMNSKEERNSVVYAGPHLFFGKPMIVKKWIATFDFHNEILKVVPIWVRLPNLSLNCWSENSLSRIGSLLGVPVYADECTTKTLRISFARIPVEIDVTKEILYEIAIEDPTGATFKQKVVYDWLPEFCKKCQVIGHNCEANTKAPAKWLKKWVPKKKIETVISKEQIPEEAQITLDEIEETNGDISHIVAPSMVVDACLGGGPAIVVETDMVNTPAVTPDHVPRMTEEEEPWKIVTRKSKGKHVAFHKNGTVNFSQLDSAKAWGARGPNPYLS